MIDIFIGAIIFSIWGVTLFFGKSIGLSMLLFAVPMTLFIIYILEKHRSLINSKAKLLIIPITLLSITYLIFNNIFFNIINIFVIPTLVAFMILELFEYKLNLNFEIIRRILDIFLMPITFIEETFEKIRQNFEEKSKIDLNNKDRKFGKILEAIIIALPVILLIIALLSSADRVFWSIFEVIFSGIINGLEKIETATIVIKIFLIICAFVYFICFFDYLISRYEIDEENESAVIEIEDNFSIKIILGVLNVIYLIFCFIQIKSLFMKSVNMNYAEYARQGFFQLMWVSLINLVTILIAKKTEKQSDEKGNEYINYMCLIMIFFTFIILVSSAFRMYLYESAYGYTFLRLLVYCCLFTEAVLLVPTILYVLGQKINLAKSYFTIILVVYICINFANFDNIIAKRNVDRYIETGKIDVPYLISKTGTDAINQIIRILETDRDSDTIIKLKVEGYLNNLYKELDDLNMDFRDFNISKIYAKRSIEKTF